MFYAHCDTIPSVIKMRMRKKPNLIPRMERCAAVQIKDPEAYRGRWHEIADCDVFVEIGCGKGAFTVGTAADNPDKLIVAVERVPDAMVIAMERAVAAKTDNVRFIDMDAARAAEIFAPGEVDRLYINFCDPWPKKRQAKRRLTSPGFLATYKEILNKNGEIHFKTDNVPLFEYSVETFAECGFELSEVTYNLHENGQKGIMTDYERKFCEQGVKIMRCVARIR